MNYGRAGPSAPEICGRQYANDEPWDAICQRYFMVGEVGERVAGSQPPALPEALRTRAIGGLEGTRIVFVLPSLEMGGAERQALVLARHLISDQGADVQVWGLGTPGPVAQTCTETGIKWHAIALPPAKSRLRQLRAFAGLVTSLRRWRPDILLPYGEAPNVICGLAWTWTGARTCVWNQRDSGLTRMEARLERLAVRRTPHFVCNSHHGVQFLTSTLGVDPKIIRVVPNGVELAAPVASRATWRVQVGADESTFVACMVANLTHRKDHETLLRAWQRVVTSLRNDQRDAILLLAGRDDSTAQDVRALARSLEIDTSVRFLGPVGDVSGLLAACDLGILSSRDEGLPNGVLECMSAGLAVAGTDILGIREAVGTEGLPYLAPAGDAERLAECILALATDADARGRLGESGRARVEEHFSPHRMCERMSNVCRSAIGIDQSAVSSGRSGSIRTVNSRPSVSTIPTARELFLSPHPTDDEENQARVSAFFRSITLRNGTHKTTLPHRLDDLNSLVMTMLPLNRPLEIMDVGVSSGITTVEWLDSLRSEDVECKITAGDLSIYAYILSFGRHVHVLVDPSGYPLQFEFLGRAVPYPPGRRRALYYPLMLAMRPMLPAALKALRRREATPGGEDVRGMQCRPVAMLSPRLKNDSQIEVVEDDIRCGEGFEGRFDVLRAANVLNNSYFSDSDLRQIGINLRSRLKVGGLLVVCRSNDQGVNNGTVFTLARDGHLEIAGRIGSGSEIESTLLALEARGPKVSR